VVDRTDNQPNSTDQSGPASGAPTSEGPLKFDFKLRLGSREETNAQLSGRATGELVQLQPIDWDALAITPDEPRTYQSDSDLQSIIVQLANQIAGPDARSASGGQVISVTASATFEPRPAASAPAPPPEPEQQPAPEPEPDLVLGSDPAPSALVATASASVAPVGSPQPSTTEAPVMALRFAPIAPLPDSLRSAAEPGESSAVDLQEPAATQARPRGINPAAASVAAAAAAAAADVTGVAGTVVDTADTLDTADDLDTADTSVVAPEVVAPEVVEILAAVQAAAAGAGPTLAPQHAAPSAPKAPPEAAVTPAPAAPIADVSMPQTVPAVPAVPAVAAAPAAPVMLTAEAAVQPAAVAAPLTLSLAKIERKADAQRPTKPVDFHALLGQAGFNAPPPKRRKKRHPFRAFFKLVVVLGVIGAGLYFGKVQVLDKRWDPDLKPIAEAVSSERDLGWKRAVKLEVLAADDYATKLATNGLFLTEVELDVAAAEWRAMGLAEGRVVSETIGAAAMAERPVFYDPIDGKIYELEDIDDELRELALHEALTEALLDQQVSWSDVMVDPAIDRGEARGIRMMVDGDADSVAGAALNLDADDIAEIDEQIAELAVENADDTLRASKYAVALLTADPGVSVLFDFADDAEARDALLEVRSDAAVLDGARDLLFSADNLASVAANTRGMFYWYHVLAGRLGSAEAWDAALAWEGDEVVIDTDTANGLCVTATVSALDEPGRLRLLDALTRWAAAAPVEAGTTVTSVGSERIDVSSCDPGADADTVLNDSISAVGEADVEYAVVGRADAASEDQQQCVVNAVRGFDVASVYARGDAVEIDSVVESIRTACENPV